MASISGIWKTKEGSRCQESPFAELTEAHPEDWGTYRMKREDLFSSSPERSLVFPTLLAWRRHPWRQSSAPVPSCTHTSHPDTNRQKKNQHRTSQDTTDQKSSWKKEWQQVPEYNIFKMIEVQKLDLVKTITLVNFLIVQNYLHEHFTALPSEYFNRKCFFFLCPQATEVTH